MILTPFALDGSSPTGGSLTPVLITNTIVGLSGGSRWTGGITVTTAGMPGAFADFGVIPYLASPTYDPAMAHVVSETIRPGTPDATTSGWFRVSITASAPSDYAPGPAGKLWGRAAFARAGIVNNAVPAANGYFMLDRGQFEPLRYGNLLTTEQSSYEGRMVYTTNVAGATFTRSKDVQYSGVYVGKYSYTLPAVTNTYQLVTSYGTYQNALDRRINYAQLLNSPPLPSEQLVPSPPPVGTGPTTFTVLPNLLGLVAVTGGTQVVASVAVATQLAGLTVRCNVLRYDASYTLLTTSTVTFTDVTSLGSLHWQTAMATLTLEATCAYVAVVPLVTAGTAQSTMLFYADQHRLWTPTTLNPAVAPASPAQAWQEPHKMIVKVRADRVNFAMNSRIPSTAGWSVVITLSVPNTLSTKSVTGVTGSTDTVLSLVIPTVTTSSLVADGWYGVTTAGMISGPSASVINITGLHPSTTYTSSVWVKAFTGQVPVTCWMFDGNSYIRGSRTTYVGAGVTRTWQRISVTFTTSETFSGDGIFRIGWASEDMDFVYRDVPPSDAEPEHWTRTTSAVNHGTWTAGTAYNTGDIVDDGTGQHWYAVIPSGARVTHTGWEMYIDDILVELGSALLPYFDGNSPGAEYLWENGVANSRSHYYRGLSGLRYRLDQAVRDYLPQGSPYQILYASSL